MAIQQRQFGLSSFLVQAALVFLPVLLLAGIGIWLLSEDRSIAQREAVQVAEDLSKRTAEEIATNIALLLDAKTLKRAHDAANTDSFSPDDPTRGWGPQTTNDFLLFGTTVGSEVATPQLVFAVDWEVDPTTPGGALYLKAQVAEFQQHDFELAARLYDEASRAQPNGREKFLALYAAGCAYSALNRSAPARDRFSAILGGSNYWHVNQLADFKSICLPEYPKNILPYLISSIVTRPTILSTELLRQIELVAGTNDIAKLEGGDLLPLAEFALKQNAHARELGSLLLPLRNSAPIDRAVVTNLDTTNYVVLRWPSGKADELLFCGIPIETFGPVVQRRAAKPQTVRLPKHFQIDTTLPGDPPVAATSLARSTALAKVPSPDGLFFCSIPITTAVSLIDAPDYYHAQNLRKDLFYTVILCSSVLAGIGLAVMRTGIVRLHRLNELKSNFVASVSHEFRAPLASVRLLAENLERRTTSDPTRQREYFKLIVQECDRLGNLIENLLTFARLERGQKRRLDLRTVDIRDSVAQSIAILQPIAQKRGVIFTIQEVDTPTSTDFGSCIVEPRAEASPSEIADQSAASPWSALADQRALMQVLLNLLDNGLKFSPPDSAIEIVLSSREVQSVGYICVSVRDSGPGIDPREHERIFEPFYRIGSEMTRETAGVGIGLSLVKQIISSHRGGLYLRSEPGKGSSFTILLSGVALPSETEKSRS